MSFTSRQQELMQRLQWAPTRGPRRQALLDELRALVTDELRREVTGAQPERRSSAEPYRRAARPFYWQDREDDEARP